MLLEPSTNIRTICFNLIYYLLLLYYIALINFSDSDVNERCMQDARYTRENETLSFLLLSL